MGLLRHPAEATPKATPQGNFKSLKDDLGRGTACRGRMVAYSAGFGGGRECMEIAGRNRPLAVLGDARANGCFDSRCGRS